MRLFFILTAFRVLTANYCQAQSSVYHAMPDSNAHWQENAFYLSPGPPPTPVYSWYTTFTEGDTIINNLVYTKTYRTGAYGAMGPQYFFSHEYNGCYREDTILKKVYFIPNQWPSEFQIYDFDLLPGDTLFQNFPSMPTVNLVQSIDSVLVGNAYHKRFLLIDLSGMGMGLTDTAYAQIEGVGSTFGFAQPIITPFEAGSQLECFVSDNYSYPSGNPCPFYVGVTEIGTAKSLTVYPNPAADWIRVDIGGKKIGGGGQQAAGGQLSVYDVSGRMLNSIHIQKGQQTLELDVSKLPVGLYVISFTSPFQVVKAKFVRQ